MSFEIQCGSCHERISVEQESGVVICPHCQTALQLPERPSGSENAQRPREAPSQPQRPKRESSPSRSPSDGSPAESAATSSAAPADRQDPLFPGLPDDKNPLSDVGLPVINTGQPALHLSADVTEHLGAMGAESEDLTATELISAEAVAGDQDGGRPTFGQCPPRRSPGEAVERGGVAAEEVEKSQPLPPDSHESAVLAHAPDDAHKGAIPEAAPVPSGKRAVSRFLFIMLLGYASAVTAALVWLYLTRGRKNPLESLPDVEPQPKGYLIPEEAPLPWGHTLRLGETRRFGSLEVTPLQVTLGPAEIMTAGLDNTQRTRPVLKLWLRFRNVSDDQTVRPFGRKLMLLRGRTAQRTSEGANIFVCRLADRNKDGRLLYTHPLEVDEDFKNQHLERRLAPGEKYTTFIATGEDGPEKLTGELLWRVHFRKGYHQTSKHGVTTLIEVRFHSDDVVQEPLHGSHPRRQDNEPETSADGGDWHAGEAGP